MRALARSDEGPSEEPIGTPLWVPRAEFLRQLGEHSMPRRAGEGVWARNEPWIAALANLVDDPAVLLAECRDWAALLDRHATVRLEVSTPDTIVRWNNAPGVAPDARECQFRLGALIGLLASASPPRSLTIEHNECLARGDEACCFRVHDLVPSDDPVHARALREAFLMAGKLQGHEALVRRMQEFSARAGPFPDVREMRAVRRFMEEIEDIILIFDHDLWVLDANRAAVRILGMTLHELRGLSARDLMDQDSFETVQRSLPRLFQTGALSGLRIVGRHRSRDLPLEVSARVAANGQSVVCIARDISGHLRLERELENRNELLEERNRRIAESGRLKSEFLANVSHELTTPLTGIQGFAKLLRHDLREASEKEGSGLTPEKRSEFLRIIQAEAQRMSDLIAGLLELSKIESGVVTLDRLRGSLNAIVQESVLLLKPRLDERERSVLLDLDPRLGDAPLDPDRMKQVVLNLLDNAIKFSPDGSEVRVRTWQTPEGVCVSVSNASVELQPEDLQRVFARFVQRDGSFTREHGGVGLGLNLVRAIVELHGGRVWAELPAPGRVEFITQIPH